MVTPLGYPARQLGAYRVVDAQARSPSAASGPATDRYGANAARRCAWAGL